MPEYRIIQAMNRIEYPPSLLYVPDAFAVGPIGRSMSPPRFRFRSPAVFFDTDPAFLEQYRRAEAEGRYRCILADDIADSLVRKTVASPPKTLEGFASLVECIVER